MYDGGGGCATGRRKCWGAGAAAGEGATEAVSEDISAGRRARSCARVAAEMTDVSERNSSSCAGLAGRGGRSGGGDAYDADSPERAVRERGCGDGRHGGAERDKESREEKRREKRERPFSERRGGGE